jgi:hypothetical protein
MAFFASFITRYALHTTESPAARAATVSVCARPASVPRVHEPWPPGASNLRRAPRSSPSGWIATSDPRRIPVGARTS